MVQAFLAAILGLASGMLVNYLSDDLPYKRRLVKPFCIHCGASIGLRNYIFWPRRCKSCGKHRSLRTWLVEIVFIGASLWLWLEPPKDLGYTLGLILLVYFGLITVIDAEHRLILHPVSLVGAGLGLAVGVSLHGVVSTLLGGVAGFGIMLVLYYLGIGYVRLIARRSRKPTPESLFMDNVRDEDGEVGEGLGFGDVNLSGVIGLMLGWPGIIAGLVLGVVLAGVASLLYILFMLMSRRYRPNMALPYGPYLVAATMFLLYFKDVV